jgi:FixJ family two-component response regulator
VDDSQCIKNKEAIVFVVEDRDEIAESIEWVLNSVNYVVKRYKSAEDFLEKYRACNNCCLILDIRMSGMSGLELQKFLYKRSIRIPVIFISAFVDVPMTVQAMKLGAVDVLMKPIEDQKLLDAVHEALKKDLICKQQHENVEKTLLLLNSLTNREKEVLNLVAQGDLNKIIAHKLGINIKTVEAHRTNTKEKLPAKNTTQMVKLLCGYELVNDQFVKV